MKKIKFNIKYLLFATIVFIKIILFFPNDKKLNHSTKAYIFSCPNHGNAGDIAIERAERKLLEKHFDTVEIINVRSFLANLSRILRHMSSNDVVCVQGGGSFGGLYWQADLERLMIFRFFKKNKIISFPQSICFINDEFKKKYVTVLKKRNNIYLYFRDKDSYELAVKSFPFMENRIILIPDIVIYLKDNSPEVKKNSRKYITLTLRSDKESALKKSVRDDMISELKSRCRHEIRIRDTYQNIFEDVEKKDQVLDQLLNLYRSSKIVVTDRLHGMILSYITNTPCIALSNNNGKVESAYNTWFRKCKYISFFREYNVNEVMDEIERLLEDIKIEDFDYDLRDGFSKLQEKL